MVRDFDCLSLLMCHIYKKSQSWTKKIEQEMTTTGMLATHTTKNMTIVTARYFWIFSVFLFELCPILLNLPLPSLQWTTWFSMYLWPQKFTNKQQMWWYTLPHVYSGLRLLMSCSSKETFCGKWVDLLKMHQFPARNSLDGNNTCVTYW